MGDRLMNGDTAAVSATAARPARWEFLALLAGAMLVPLAPARPIETTFAACVFGISYGYLRLRKGPMSLQIIWWAIGALLLSMAIAALLAVRVDHRWLSGAAWLGMLFGLTAGWIERECSLARILRDRETGRA